MVGWSGGRVAGGRWPVAGGRVVGVVGVVEWPSDRGRGGERGSGQVAGEIGSSGSSEGGEQRAVVGAHADGRVR
ncbi:hypothetical protein [Micromonospora sp. DH14]|uniref:hypothetical protein n=1 Tax=Micromonospora sp. DH14 TaxID=3040120 RepID=UPI002441201A|nr:hypothetical protein [Micromonospora sp. DH14]MDG9678239.1 hypothetical protein [Micromonospora sp. DH14]